MGVCGEVGHVIFNDVDVNSQVYFVCSEMDYCAKTQCVHDINDTQCDTNLTPLKRADNNVANNCQCARSSVSQCIAIGELKSGVEVSSDIDSVLLIWGGIQSVLMSVLIKLSIIGPRVSNLLCIAVLHL